MYEYNTDAVTASTENDCKFILVPPPASPFNDTAPGLAEPLTALYKFPNDKSVLAIIIVLFSVINI
jgi:hypothetical protein